MSTPINPIVYSNIRGNKTDTTTLNSVEKMDMNPITTNNSSPATQTATAVATGMVTTQTLLNRSLESS